MRSRPSGSALWKFASHALLTLLLMFCVAGPARAEDERKNLQLEVFINDVPAHMIGAFVLIGGTRLGATRNELEEVGLHIGRSLGANDFVWLDTVPQLEYRYDEPGQRVYFKVDNGLRTGRVYDLSDASRRAVRARSDWSALLNYDVVGAGATANNFTRFSYSGASATFDARAISPYGVLEQTAIVREGPYGVSTFLRLDTYVQHADQDSMINYRAGDLVSNSFAWTRSIRIGGFQAQRDFTLRPDLITAPLPTLGATAAVPSTADLYINNVKTFSQEVAPGPFSLNNIPSISGSGNAQLVLRDSSGNETKVSAPFYTSANLLAQGKMDWSLEAGLPRLSYGAENDSYLRAPVGSASLRGGIFDWLTGQAHAEGGAGLLNGGLGAAFNIFNRGALSLAGSFSHSPEGNGAQGYLAFETSLGPLFIAMSSQHTFGTFDDLASVTSRLSAALSQAPGMPGYMGIIGVNNTFWSNIYSGGLPIYSDGRPPRQIDRISIGAPLPFDRKSNVSAALVNYLTDSAGRSLIAQATYSRMMPYDASLFATAFHDFGVSRNTGIVVGFSIPLGKGITASSNYSGGAGGANFVSDVSRPLGPERGDFGWRVQDGEGASPYRSAELSARTGFGVVRLNATQAFKNAGASIDLRGSLIEAGGSVFAADWVDDGFAVVKSGAPNLRVFNENRPIGETNDSGMLLVPSLRSYSPNHLTVDPTNLPVDAEIVKSNDAVAPADHGGIIVDFAVKNNSDAALAVFRLSDGSFIPAGAVGKLDGGEEFVIGYDGQAFLKGLHESNQAAIDYMGKTCKAIFPFAPNPGAQVRLGPIPCQ